jgi:hypothetical protein
MPPKPHMYRVSVPPCSAVELVFLYWFSGCSFLLISETGHPAHFRPLNQTESKKNSMPPRTDRRSKPSPKLDSCR